MAEKHPTSLSPNLKQRIEIFSGYTTFHGLHFVIGADRGVYRRIIWLILILTGLGILTRQLVKSCEKLLAREHVITRDIIPSKKLVFPAVTICNVNMMRKSRIKGTDAQIYLDQQNVLKKLMSAKISNPSKNLTGSFDIEKAVLRYGHTAEDMVDVCTWDGEFCSHLNFTTRYSQIYGLCHTFNSGRQGHLLLYSTSIKRSRGLHLLIDIKKYEYYGISSYFNTGIRMVIHDQDEEPMVEGNGIDVMPGHMTTMKIQRTEYHSLQHPYKSDCGRRRLQTSKIYTRSSCLLECNTRKFVKTCGCRLLGMPKLEEFTGTAYCSSTEIMSCLLPNLTTVGLQRGLQFLLMKYFISYDGSYSSDNPQEECSCPKPCKKVQYKIAQLNTVSFVSESFWNEFYLMRLSRGVNASRQDLEDILAMRSYFRENYLFLIVHYDDLQTLSTSEREAYQLIDLGADVGGYLGLFLGCSVLTIFEFLDLIISCILSKQKTENDAGQTTEMSEKI